MIIKSMTTTMVIIVSTCTTATIYLSFEEHGTLSIAVCLSFLPLPLYVMCSMLFGAPTNPAGISEVVRWWNSAGQLCMGLLRLRTYMVDGGRAWSFCAAFQPLSTPAFTDDDAEASPRADSNPLPLFDTPNDQRCKHESTVIMHRISALDFMTLHFSHFEEDVHPPFRKKRSVETVGGEVDDVLFAPLQMLPSVEVEEERTTTSSIPPPKEDRVVAHHHLGGVGNGPWKMPQQPAGPPTFGTHRSSTLSATDLPPEDLALLQGLFQEGGDASLEMMRHPQYIPPQRY